MGDLQRSWSNSSPSCSLFSSSPIQPPVPVDIEVWLMAEQRTQEIICAIQPFLLSDRHRKEIINYVQKLIKDRFGTEVFSFGSVPFKTYLPDGDIDLTVLSRQKEEDLANDLLNVLEEERNSNFIVKDINYIRAQVKVLKCKIRNIAVDISFNQLEGLSALCFLEQVDRIIGKDHLFKRSIILIKAWCFYESRILGANCGLFSTYAVEVLVLYIINLFHSTLYGPLAVFYKFLDYYSKFDWDNYCVSVIGPVSISSLPNILVGAPDNDGTRLLFNQEFLEYCMEVFSRPFAVNADSRAFTKKHLNIIDPLKKSNNLGRSVSVGNALRIRSVLSYGAQKLREILMLPGESMGSTLENFFVNTLNRNGKGLRHDIQMPVTAFGTGRSEPSELSGYYEDYYNTLLYAQSYRSYIWAYSSQPGPSSPASEMQGFSWGVVHNYQYSYDNESYLFFVPQLSFYTSQPPATYYGFQIPGMSRGTGTYIPRTNLYQYRDRRSFPSRRNPERTTYRPLLRSSERAEQVTNPQEKSNGESSNSLDLSLEEFPPLVTAVDSTPSEIQQLAQLTWVSHQAEDRATSSESTKLETSKSFSSLFEQPLAPMQPVDSASSSASGSQSIEGRPDPKAYRLEDDTDFPPLSA